MIEKKLMGVKIDLNEINLTKEEKLFDDKENVIGHLRSAAFSPKFKKVVGIAMIKKNYWDKKTTFELEINNKKNKGIICSLPLI